MKYILLWLFLIVQILPQGYGSYGRNKNIPKFYYTYTPETDTAINITPYSATLIGNDNRVKSNRADTSATKKSVQNWMVWWCDSTNFLANGSFDNSSKWNVTDFIISSGVASYGDNEIGALSQDVSLKQGKTYNLTFTVSNTTGLRLAVSGNILFDWIVTQSTFNNGTYSYTFVPTQDYNALFFFGYPTGSTGDLDNILCYPTIDSSQGTSVSLTGLADSLTYSYYHSIIVKANDGDLDYYKGETKAFTTLALPEGNYLQTEDLIYVVTEDGYYIQFEGE